MLLVGCLYYLCQWCTVKQISDNEIYLLIKYIKSVLWRVAKRLSLYTGRTVPKVKPRESAFKQFKSPVLSVLKYVLRQFIRGNSLQKGKLPVFILSHINTVHTLTKDLNRKHFNIIPHLGASLRSRLFPSVLVCTSLHQMYYRDHPFYSSRFDYQDENWWGVLKQLVMLFLPVSISCNSFSDTNIFFGIPFSNTLRSAPPLQQF